MELFTSIGMGLLIWFGAEQLFSSDVTIGVLIAFIMYSIAIGLIKSL